MGLDIEGVLAKWSGCWCGEQQHPDHDPRVRDCPQHGSDDCRHMAEGIVVDLRDLTAQIAAAQAEAWDEGFRTACGDQGIVYDIGLRPPNPYRAAQLAPARVPSEEG